MPRHSVFLPVVKLFCYPFFPAHRLPVFVAFKVFRVRDVAVCGLCKLRLWLVWLTMSLWFVCFGVVRVLSSSPPLVARLSVLV
jgi:hypothetical protein